METLSAREQQLHRTLIRELTKDELGNKVRRNSSATVTIGQAAATSESTILCRSNLEYVHRLSSDLWRWTRMTPCQPSAPLNSELHLRSTDQYITDRYCTIRAFDMQSRGALQLVFNVGVKESQV